MMRLPVYADQFYAGNSRALRKQVEDYLDHDAKKMRAIGCISPHAGYICSGPVAGAVLSSIESQKTYIIIGPNHTGSGMRFGLDASKSWQTPLGEVEIDSELSNAILKSSPMIKKDSACHLNEHSVEVQLPFLQILNKSFTFVPIVVSHATLDEYLGIGRALATAAKATKKDLTIIASSDMTHYEARDVAIEKDNLAIEKILNLDISGLLENIEKHDITMCGYGPTAIMMSAALDLGAKKAKLIKYLTSGDTCGDNDSVVGYAGIVLY